jgi:hypothetical protein
MAKRYNNPERQTRMHTYLKSLRFISFRFGENLDASSTLTALTSEISKLSQMGPPQYQGEIHAVEHPRNAVLGEMWANDVLRAMNPQTISFSELPRTPGSTSSVPQGGTDSAGKRIGANGVGWDGHRRTCYNPICKSPDHTLVDKKYYQTGMRSYVEEQVDRNPKTASSILFAMMGQYADEDTDVEEKVVANGLDEEYADEDGSDIEAQVNRNNANEREPEFSRDVDAKNF